MEEIMRLLTAGLHGDTRRPIVLLPLLLALACGGDDGNGPTEPENGISEEEQAARAQEQVRGLFTTLEPVVVQAMGLLLQGGGTIQGEQGTLVVAGTTMTLEGFSADGQLVLDGELTLDILAQPVTLKGDLVASGLEGQEGPVDVNVDITIDPTTDPRTYGGTVTVGEVVYDLAELLAEEEG